MSTGSRADDKTIATRDEMVQVLQHASQLEHNLCCLYLFAAFSLRKSLEDFPPSARSTEAGRKACYLVMNANRFREIELLRIARQEMEHLGIDQNLLAALGSAPYFARANFPIPADHYAIDLPFHLERFGTRSLARFMLFEKPDYITDVEWLKKLAHGQKGDCPKCRPNHFPLPPHPPLDPFNFHSVQELYDALRNAFDNLPPAEIYRGNSQRQVEDEVVQFVGNVTMVAVMNADTANQAIDLIISQGEGIGLDPLSPNSHFSRFTEVMNGYREYLAKNPDGPDVSLPVLCNPMVEGHGFRSHEPSNLVTTPLPRSLMMLFNDAYYLMLVMLQNFFATYRGYFGTYPSFRGQNANMALFEMGFFPFMTMVIRPLGELIMRIPAGDGHPGKTAGPSFQLRLSDERGWAIPLITELDWYLEALERLSISAAEIAEKAGSSTWAPFFEGGFVQPEACVAQLEYMHENLHRMKLDVKALWKHGGTDAPF